MNMPLCIGGEREKPSLSLTTERRRKYMFEPANKGNTFWIRYQLFCPQRVLLQILKPCKFVLHHWDKAKVTRPYFQKIACQTDRQN